MVALSLLGFCSQNFENGNKVRIQEIEIQVKSKLPSYSAKVSVILQKYVFLDRIVKLRNQ